MDKKTIFSFILVGVLLGTVLGMSYVPHLDKIKTQDIQRQAEIWTIKINEQDAKLILAPEVLEICSYLYHNTPKIDFNNLEDEPKHKVTLHLKNKLLYDDLYCYTTQSNWK